MGHLIKNIKPLYQENMQINQQSTYYKQVFLLLKVLPYVFEDGVFALKGGTAINMFVKNMPRMSIDIDLTYIPLEPRLESLKNIDKGLKKIAAR